MSLLDQTHGRFVHSRRVAVLAQMIAAELPHGAHALDVGAGDGKLGALIGALRPDLRIEGLDVLVRPDAAIPVRAFDGLKLPLADQSVDAVFFVDVLHHADDAQALLADAARVARQRVVIKDHFREGFLANTTLRFMDWVGNARHGVALPYHYVNRAEWQALLDRAKLQRVTETRNVPIYPGWASWAFGRGLHFVGAYRPTR
jgi:SAM-dependent methyltransferase